MTGRLAADAAIDAFLADGITELPDRAFEAVRADIHHTRQRLVLGPLVARRPPMAAQLAVAAAIAFTLGVTWNNLVAGPHGVGGSPSSSPTVESHGASAPPTSGPAALISGARHELVPGRYVVDYAHVPGTRTDGPSISFDIGATGWVNMENFGIELNLPPEAVSPGAALVFWNITNLSVEPCTNHQPRPTAPGAGIDQLLEALGAQPGIRPGPIRDELVDGYAGKSVNLTIVASVADCPDGFFPWGSQADGRRADATGEVDRVYALDVDGQRVTFFLRRVPDTPDVDVRQLERVIASIDIQP